MRLADPQNLFLTLRQNPTPPTHDLAAVSTPPPSDRARAPSPWKGSSPQRRCHCRKGRAAVVSPDTDWASLSDAMRSREERGPDHLSDFIPADIPPAT